MRIPKHIGIIPDGNRRWAVQHGLQKQEGYSYGLAPGLALFRQAAEHRLPASIHDKPAGSRR